MSRVVEDIDVSKEGPTSKSESKTKLVNAVSQINSILNSVKLGEIETKSEDSNLAASIHDSKGEIWKSSSFGNDEEILENLK